MSGPKDGIGVHFARVVASSAARRAGAALVEPAHMMIGLCDLAEVDRAMEQPGLVVDLSEEVAGELARDAEAVRLRFARARLDPSALSRRIRDRAGIRRPTSTEETELLRRSPATRQAFERATALAAEAGSSRVGPEHLLRALLEHPVPQWSVPAAELGVDDLFSACFTWGESRTRPDRVEVEVVGGSMAGRRLVATEPTRWIVGRDAVCHLRVPDDVDPRMSRFHALVEVNPPYARVRDMGSSNGTFVNGRELPGGDAEPGAGDDGVVLTDGDHLRLADTELRVRIRSGGAPGVGPRPTRLEPGGVRRPAPPDRPPPAAPRPPPGPRPTPTPTPNPAPTPPPSGRDRAAKPPRPYHPTRRLTLCRVCTDPVEKPGTGATDAILCSACLQDPDRIVSELVRRLEAGEQLPGLFGGYTVLEQLGAGGMGAVYLALDEQTDEQVAIKIMLPTVRGTDNASALFRREADNAKQLRHPHILRHHEHADWAGIFYLVTEYCDGGDLRARMVKNRGPLSPRRAVNIALQTLDALHHAHRAEIIARLADDQLCTTTGLVHRDISPGNLLFRDGVLKIGDFGLSKAFGVAGLSGFTGSSTAGGKPYFITRRQLTDYRDVGPEVDVWAVAACLYYMLTGEAPRDFRGRAGAEFQAVMELTPLPIRQRERSVPQVLADVIDGALVEEPTLRYWSAAELAAELEAVLRVLPS